MSYEIGIDTINLKPTPCIAHTEYCSNDALKRQLGVTRSAFAGPTEQAFNTTSGDSDDRCFEDMWEIDLIWHTHDGPIPWSQRGRVTDMGHADFLEGGVDRRESHSSPFEYPDQVHSFNAVQ